MWRKIMASLIAFSLFIGIMPVIPVTAADDVTYHKDVSDTAADLRKGMVNREETISVGYSTNNMSEIDEAFVEGLFNEAMAHTGNPKEGDYLYWQFDYNSTSLDDPEVSASGIKFTFRLKYYTTAEQEAEVDTLVEKLLSDLNVNSMSDDYTKIKAIYDYLCENISFDEEHQNNSDYTLQYTAYAALKNKTAACRGFSVLLYRLALELGIDSRVIVGTTGGQLHTWNLIQMDDNLYYNADATWDSHLNEHACFLVSDDNMPDHKRDADYATEDYYKQYPMGEEDYVYESGAEPEPEPEHKHSYSKSVTEPTCTKEGYTTYTCSCGDTYTDDKVAATGHVYQEDPTWKWSSDHKEAEATFTCSTCKATETVDCDVAIKEADDKIIYTATCEFNKKTYEQVYEEAVEKNELPFTDVSADDWYYDSVVFVYERDLMRGTTDTTFAPEEQLTRAMFATILYRANGEPKVEYEKVFSDVEEGEWYTDGIMWAYQNGIVKGYDNGKFGTKDNITREQLAVMMYRYANYMKYDTSKTADFDEFQDGDKVSEWAEDAMKWAIGNEIIHGKGNYLLDPQGQATRAECATIIMRFLELYED